MVNANELRIGNWITLDWDGEKRNQQIDGVSNSGAVFIGEWDEDFGLDCLYPIPLTTEIFKKCGSLELPKWNEFGNSMIIVNSETGIAYTETGLICVAIINNKEGELIQRSGSFLHHVKHLHQLQNLYFALNGTELEIKL